MAQYQPARPTPKDSAMPDTNLTTNVIQRVENDVIAALALRASEAQQLDARGIYVGTDDHGAPHLIDITDKTFALDERRPARKTGAYAVTTVEDFLAYLNKHALPQTELWASENAATVEAIINAHMGTTGDGVEDYAGHEDHTATLRLPFTPDWKAWTQHNGGLLPQLEFSEFIEDHLPNFVDPTGADMLDLAQTFQATTKVDFESGQRVKSGETQLVYKEHQDATAGKAGRIAIPDTFTLALRVHEGGPLYKVEARFRYRIAQAGLRLGYKLTRPEDTLRDAFKQVLEQIKAGGYAPWLIP